MMEHAFIRFIEELEQGGIPLHSAVLLYKQEVVCQRYFPPFEIHMLHRMYSVSKSFISLAIGCLCGEGKLQLSDGIAQYFPEYIPAEPSPWLMQMSIEHMLKMQTCHKMTTYKNHMEEPWVPSFFTTVPHHEPGTIFMYDTSATHVLCRLVEKLSGKEIMEYLRECFLDEIGFSKDAYFIRNKFDEAMGGSGLMATTQDMVAFARLLMSEGNHHGKQLIPREYIKAATAFQAPTLITGPVKEEQQGYGYQFWRFTHGGFGCYGMGGQLILCYPDYELALVTTADTMGIQGGNQAIYNSLYRNIMPETMYQEKKAGHRTNEESCRTIHWNVWYRCGKDSFCEKIHFGQNEILFEVDGRTYELQIGWDKNVKIGHFPVYGDACATRAQWLDERCLYVRTEFLGENLASFEMQVVFQDERFTGFMKNTQELGYEEFSGWFRGDFNCLENGGVI